MSSSQRSFESRGLHDNAVKVSGLSHVSKQALEAKLEAEATVKRLGADKAMTRALYDHYTTESVLVAAKANN